MAERTKPRIKYWKVPLSHTVPPGWFVLLPETPENVWPERFDTWPQALARVQQWYEEKDEQRRRIQGKITVLVDRLKA